jgi:hypothetical protein
MAVEYYVGGGIECGAQMRADAEVEVGRLGLGAAAELEAHEVDKDHGGHELKVAIAIAWLDVYHSCEQQDWIFPCVER